jgi:hypothetical protein
VRSIRETRDVRGFAAHQLARELDAGRDLPAAAQNLRTALPDGWHWAVAELESTISGAGAPPRSRQLANLLAIAADAGVSRERAFTAYESAARDPRDGLANALAGGTTLGTYLALLAFMLVIVSGIYSLFVLPQFRVMYESFGARLPLFTETAIGTGWLIVPVLLLVIAAVVLYLVGLSKVKHRLEMLEPMRPLLGRVPGLKGWASDHDMTLWLRYFALLLDAGATPEAAAAAATKLAGDPADHRPRLLSGAATLGRLREEVQRLIDEDARDALVRFEEPRNALVLAMRVIIYLIVSGLVLAMYLPIFKLGSII